VRALSKKIEKKKEREMAITIAFPVLFLMNHFLYQFSAFSEKMKKIYRLEV